MSGPPSMPVCSWCNNPIRDPYVNLIRFDNDLIRERKEWIFNNAPQLYQKLHEGQTVFLFCANLDALGQTDLSLALTLMSSECQEQFLAMILEESTLFEEWKIKDVLTGEDVYSYIITWNE